LIAYFDTSAVLPLIIEETGSSVASRLWDEADRVVSSRLVYPEGRAALAMAFRMHRLDRKELRVAVEVFDALHDQIDIVEVTGRLARSAGSVAEKFGLRGYDAVHLASASEIADSEVVLAAGDRSLLVAARALGIATTDLNSTGS
jgi:predicted nucleic acid-binding protein